MEHCIWWMFDEKLTKQEKTKKWIVAVKHFTYQKENANKANSFETSHGITWNWFHGWFPLSAISGFGFCRFHSLQRPCFIFVRIHLRLKSIRLIICKPSSIGMHIFQLLISKVWYLNSQNWLAYIQTVPPCFLSSVYSLMLVWCKQLVFIFVQIKNMNAFGIPRSRRRFWPWQRTKGPPYRVQWPARAQNIRNCRATK